MSLNNNAINTNAINSTTPSVGSVGGGVVVTINQSVLAPVSLSYGLNIAAINTNPVNGSASEFVSAIGGGVVVSIVQAVKAIGFININVAQKVGKLSTATIAASIEQEVELRSISTPGIAATIKQEVRARASKVIDVEQTVIVLSDPTSFYGRNGYEPQIYIDDVQVPLNQLHGKISCVFTEEKAPQLTFSIIPPVGLQDVRKYVGNNVIFNIMQNVSGTPVISRVFTGKVNTPDIQILKQKIEFSCSLDIEQNTESLTRSYLDSIGTYSNKLFSKPETQLEELTDRISTIPNLINVDNFGVVGTKSIITKVTADKTYNDSNIYRRSLDFVLGSRQRYINKVNVNISYSYERLHHHERQFALAGSGTFCQSQTRNILLRSLVEGAARGGGWAVKDGISYSPIWPAGWYGCNKFGVGGNIAWSGGISCTAQLIPVTDSDGNAILNDGVKKKEVVRSCVDISQTLCTGAGWTAATRFSQSILNEFTLVVEATKSIAQNGEKIKTRNYNITDAFDSTIWEDYKSYRQGVPAGSVKNTVGVNFYIDATYNIDDYTKAATIAMNTARNEILKSHRSDRVVFERSLTPSVLLTDTIELTADKISTKASVNSYTHDIDISSGEAVTKFSLVLTQSEGSTTDSVLTVPSLITNTPTYDTATVNLGGYFGVDPNSPALAGVGGYFTDDRAPGSFFKTNYGTSVRVVTPPIDTLRKESKVQSTSTYDVDIPHDRITIDFDQWN